MAHKGCRKAHLHLHRLVSLDPRCWEVTLDLSARYSRPGVGDIYGPRNYLIRPPQGNRKFQYIYKFFFIRADDGTDMYASHRLLADYMGKFGELCIPQAEGTEGGCRYL